MRVPFRFVLVTPAGGYKLVLETPKIDRLGGV
jgi:hypothetical protein